jgi:hypothetical protein
VSVKDSVEILWIDMSESRKLQTFDAAYHLLCRLNYPVPSLWM